MLAKVKNILKRVLPVPARTHNAQMETILQSLQKIGDELGRLEDKNMQLQHSIKVVLDGHNNSVLDQAKQMAEILIQQEKLTENNYKKIEKKQAEVSQIITSRVAKTFKKRTIEHLDFHLTDHCNLNCKSCSVYSPISPKRFADPEAFRADLTQLHSLVGDNVLRIHLLGGEPLLHPQVEQFPIICRSIFRDARIDFTTNGLLVCDMPPSFWNVLRSNDITLQYSRYPINFDYDKMVEYVRDKGVNVFSVVDEIKYFVRFPLNVKGTFNISQSYIQCHYTDCAQLRDGRLYHCPASAFVGILNKELQEVLSIDKFHPHPDDYLDIYQAKGKDAVLEFLSCPIPFCRYCGWMTKEFIPWGYSNRDIKEWVDI